MAAPRTETITVRIAPAINRGLKDMAERERRSQVNLIEIMIRDYCARNDVTVAEQDGP